MTLQGALMCLCMLEAVKQGLIWPRTGSVEFDIQQETREGCVNGTSFQQSLVAGDSRLPWVFERFGV